MKVNREVEGEAYRVLPFIQYVSAIICKMTTSSTHQKKLVGTKKMLTDPRVPQQGKLIVGSHCLKFIRLNYRVNRPGT